MMSAYSLRTWRRNGVACDELIFLPGTPYGQSHGVEGPPVMPPHEGDAAAGPPRSEMESLATIDDNNNNSTDGDQEMGPLRTRVTSIEFDDVDLEEDEDGKGTDRIEALATQAGGLNTGRTDESGDSFEQWDDEHSDEDNTSRRLSCLKSRGNNTSNHIADRSLDASMPDSDPNDNDMNGSDAAEEMAPLQRFRENHPRIIRIGTFFFFRQSSSASSGSQSTYAPSGPSVFGAGLDLSMPICFNFHLFILAYNQITPGVNDGAETQAKILPLIFLSVLIVRSFFPPGRRQRFWSTIKFTAVAPFHRVRFRDAFLGDVLTSLVRPMQDVLFALSYYGTVIYGTVIGSYTLSEAGMILENSWVLHYMVLPCCALLPLWWKFLQTLRQAYDANQRWPHLGDAFKYLSAAMVVLYGMTHPETRRSAWWIAAFCATVAYQIWWDTMIDWELFVVVPRAPAVQDPSERDSSCCAPISSLRPSSIMLPLQVYLIQPIHDAARRLWASIPHPEQIQLRPQRLYKTDAFYYRIFIMNAILRFTWMLCLIPSYRLTALSDVVTTENCDGDADQACFRSDVNTYIGVLLPAAEIVRRCFWGLLRVEKETIRMTDSPQSSSSSVLTSRHGYRRVRSSEGNNGNSDGSNGTDRDDGNDDEEEQQPLRNNSKHDNRTATVLPTWLDAPSQQQAAAGSSPSPRLRKLVQLREAVQQHLFVAELSLWALAFVGLGCWATF